MTCQVDKDELTTAVTAAPITGRIFGHKKEGIISSGLEDNFILLTNSIKSSKLTG